MDANEMQKDDFGVVQVYARTDKGDIGGPNAAY